MIQIILRHKVLSIVLFLLAGIAIPYFLIGDELNKFTGEDRQRAEFQLTMARIGCSDFEPYSYIRYYLPLPFPMMRLRDVTDNGVTIQRYTLFGIPAGKVFMSISSNTNGSTIQYKGLLRSKVIKKG